MIIKGNQPSLLGVVRKALAGPDSGFAASSWTQENTGHGRRERRGIRTAPAAGIDWPGAAQILRIRLNQTPGTTGHTTQTRRDRDSWAASPEATAAGVT